MSAAQQITVGDRSPTGGEEIARQLRMEGFAVTVVTTGAAFLEHCQQEGASLGVVDIGLPDLGGTELLKRIRRDPALKTLPLILFNDQDDEIDRVVCFELGADDYLVRPFSLREMALRVRAILRRTQPGPTPAREQLVVGPVEIDLPRHKVLVDGRHLKLTPLEFRLLSHLAEQPGRVQTRESLLERVWRQPGEAVTRAVDTSVKRLRRKLGPAGEWIETVRGVGYRMRDARRPSSGSTQDRCG